MSGGGFITSKKSKLIVKLIGIAMLVLSGTCFVKAFPFTHVLTSVVLIVFGILLLLISFILLALLSNG